MNKRTVKAAAGNSSISPAAARSAARRVYRDARTGKLVVEDLEQLRKSASHRRRRKSKR